MRSYLRLSCVVLLLLFAAMAVAQAPAPKAKPAAKSEARPEATQKAFFPYPVEQHVLANGLPVIIIRAPEFKDMATYATAVFAGSRNETEKGKTGLAHLFEHIMFRHEFGGLPGGYDQMIRRMGADNNAWTDYDMTFYHPSTFSANLIGPVQAPGGEIPGLIELEAARFQNLTLDKKIFQVEAGAVLGEYRRIFSDPSEKMVEEMSPVAYPHHPYGHTVIGYADDVANMPNAWDAAWSFYHDYYAPNDVAVIVVGDVEPKRVLAEIEKRYANWKPSEVPAIPAEAAPTKEERVHVNWGADVAPRLMVGYHTPAMKPGSKETAVQMILAELLVSRSAPLFQKVRYQKQTVNDIGLEGGPEFIESTDPHLLLIDAELVQDKFKEGGDKYVGDVEGDIENGVDALKTFSKDPTAAKTLAVVKSKVRNDFLANLDSTLSIAQAFGWYYRFGRDPGVIDHLMQAIDALQPADIDAYASQYFTPQRRVVTTLWQGPEQPASPAKEGK